MTKKILNGLPMSALSQPQGVQLQLSKDKSDDIGLTTTRISVTSNEPAATAAPTTTCT